MKIIKKVFCIVFVLLFFTGNIFGRGKNDLLLLPSPKLPMKILKKAMYLSIFNTGKSIIAVGEQGFIIYTYDNGRTWYQAEVPVRVTLTGVYFSDNKNGWAVGNCGVILHTADGGKTWVKQLDGNTANKLIVKKLKAIIEKKEYGSNTLSLDDLKYFLKDATRNIKEGPTWPFLNVWFRDKNFGIAIGGFGKIFLTENGGKTWESLLGKLNNPDGFHYYDIGELNKTIFMAGEGGILFRADNEADNWELLKSPSDTSFFGLNINNADNSVIVYGMKGLAFQTKDSGETWKKIFSLNNINKIIVSSIILNNNLCFLSNDSLFFCQNQKSSKFEKEAVKMRGCVSLCKGKGNTVFGACANGVHEFKVNIGEK